MTICRTQDDVELYYEFDPTDAGPPLVFLNGMTQSTAHWKRLAGSMSGEFDVLRYDARGQGDSQVGETDLTLVRHADDLCSVLDHARVARAHLVGFSHGARVALAFAARHPDRVDRLVLCSATAEPTALARTIVRSWKGILDAGGGVEALAWASLPMILGERFLQTNEKILSGIVRATVKRNHIDGVRALIDGLLRYRDLTEFAEQVRAPTLVVSADEDPLVTADGALALARLTGGRWRQVEGVGHTIPIEAPNQFRDILLDFLRG